jgi:hypothetical protein
MNLITLEKNMKFLPLYFKSAAAISSPFINIIVSTECLPQFIEISLKRHNLRSKKSRAFICGVLNENKQIKSLNF